MSSRASAEQTVRDIRRKTRKQYSAEEKIRIVLSGLRGEDSIAELCRREGIAESLYYFGLRGLAQSMARELAPKNVHVAHFVIDGGIRQCPHDPRSLRRGDDGMLDPDAIAETYLAIHRQHRSAWTWEVELRPWVETF